MLRIPYKNAKSQPPLGNKRQKDNILFLLKVFVLSSALITLDTLDGDHFFFWSEEPGRGWAVWEEEEVKDGRDECYRPSDDHKPGTIDNLLSK